MGKGKHQKAKVLDLTHLEGTILIISDPHGTSDEAEFLINVVKPDHIVCGGDLCDRGSDLLKLLALIKTHNIISVKGNHDLRLWKHLTGRNVAITHGLQETIDQLAHLTEDERKELADYLHSLPDVILLPHGGVVVHAGFHLQSPLNEQLDECCYYIRTMGDKRDKRFDVPGNKPWYEQTQHPFWHDKTIFFGHAVHKECQVKENIFSLDQGAVFGLGMRCAVWRDGKVTTISIPSKKHYEKKD